MGFQTVTCGTYEDLQMWILCIHFFEVHKHIYLCSTEAIKNIDKPKRPKPEATKEAVKH